MIKLPGDHEADMNSTEQHYPTKSDDAVGPPKPWRRIADPVFERVAGPLWVCEEEGNPIYALVSEERHDNGVGNVHGGVLALLADHALGLRLRTESGWSRQATVQLELAYLAAAKPGDFIEVRSEILRSTRNLAFIRATLDVGEKTVASAHGIWKINRD